jgi:rod shape-determining protein MreD
VNPLAVSPDLVLVLVFCWSARRSLREDLIWAFAIGLVVDTLILDPLGANALALLPVVLLGLLARRRVIVTTVALPVVLVVLATIAHAFVLGAIRHTGLDLKVVLVQSLMHAVLVPVFYLVLNVFDPGALQEAGR